MGNLRSDVARLEKAAGATAADPAGVEVWIPTNGRGDRPPGRYAFPGGVTVIYRPGVDPGPPAGAIVPRRGLAVELWDAL